MALQGTLDTFALPDVLRLLAATKKTGLLRITSGRGDGSLWVDGGSLSSIEARHAPRAVEPVDALFELLRFEEGSFTFDADASPDATGPANDVDELLDAAGVLLEEWRQLEQVVPSLDAWVALRASLEAAEVTIGQQHWTTLVAVGAGSTVGQVGEALDLPELPVSRAVRDLVDLGLVDVSPRPPTPRPTLPSGDGSSSGAPPAEPSEPPMSTEPGHDDAAASPATDSPETTDVDAPVVVEDSEAETSPVEAAEHDGDAPLPSAPQIRARRARGSSRPAPDPFAAPERFVPIELPGRGPASYDSDDQAGSEGGPTDVDDLTAAFPGLANRSTTTDPAEDGGDPDDLAGQLAALPPEVADAVRAAAEAPTDEERDAALDGIPDDDAAPVNRGLLLKFLSSVRG